MLEHCAAKSQSKSVLQQAAVKTLNRWRQAGGCNTQQICHCGTQLAAMEGITTENASEQWWPIEFNWLDA
jgi:hypothetical protein